MKQPKEAPVKDKSKTGTAPKSTVIITYNSVTGYPAGTYTTPKGEPVVVYSHDNTRTWNDMAPRKLGELLHGLYGRINPKDVQQIYLYIGKYAAHGALQAAQELRHDGNALTLVACDCDSYGKEMTARSIHAPLVWAECGGRKTLGRIVDELLNR